jgi:galactokinase
VAGVAQVVRRFHGIYPSSGDPKVWRAPGRVNLIGEHTDYNLGLVLPMAIQLECVVAAASSEDDVLRVYSDRLARGAQWRVEDIPNLAPQGEWSDRVAGIAWELARRGVAIAAQHVLICSTVPLGGGLSSSAALGVAMTLALGGPRDPLELAQVARAAEMDFVGVPCGIMDQFVAAHGRAGAAILLDCRSLDWRAVKLPEEIAIVAANSMVRHELSDSAYRRRVEECAEAARLLGVASLRDATLDRLSELNGVALKRARHVLTENARVETFAAAAERGDLEGMGRALIESHRSLRDDYEVSCAELDFLVETALEIPGVLGARMTGGGFGGSTVNLVRRDAVDTLEAALLSKYAAAFGRTPEFHVCIASAGASRLNVMP